MRELVYYVATSIDGFIAAPDGDTGYLENTAELVAALFDRYPETCPAHLRDVFGIAAPPARFDTVILGAKTHQLALDAGLTSAYPHLRQLVVTTRDLPDDPTVERISGDVRAIVRNLKATPGKDIWLCGGGSIAAQLADEIDEIQLKINPVLIGAGTPLVAAEFASSRWVLCDVERLPSHVVLHTYRRT